MNILMMALLPLISVGSVTLPTEQGPLSITPIADNAVRVKIAKPTQYEQEELIYLPTCNTVMCQVEDAEGGTRVILPKMSVWYDNTTQTLDFYDKDGNLVLAEKPAGRAVEPSSVQGFDTWRVSQQFISPVDEYLYGTGQYQDGYLNVRGLPRRLTQVNTQIALPMILSSKGYGLLWNNYGLTEFNPCTNSIALSPLTSSGETFTVDVTSTEGKKSETRSVNGFEGWIEIEEDGNYGMLLDAGQTMARKHKLLIDNELIFDNENVWLPPTMSGIVPLQAGKHHVVVEGDKNDKPTIQWQKVADQTEFMSPVSQGIDYTVFVGSGDEVIGAYRRVTGEVPRMPDWAFGYVHCRERYDTQAELLDNAREFVNRGIPVDVIVQDWQWWGKHGWNAMEFDADKYPDPKSMVDELHANDMRLMLSVWAKIDRNSKLGKDVADKNYYISGTEWIDFFNPEAAKYYSDKQVERILKPYHIDAWWQDATEPENDDLAGRMVNNGTLPGEVYRNAFPLFVNRAVYGGFKEYDPEYPIMIMTRSAFPGIQRYGIITWSGDVGHDWKTLRTQIAGGLGQMAAGLPWWTFDAGGFFRPSDQYSNKDYHEVMIRWLQTATFLPIMRVHGFVSQTEPWRYGPEVEEVFKKYINIRYELKPYIIEMAKRVSDEGYTLMRPLVMDFADDEEALKQDCQFMFGPKYLVAPVTAPGVSTWRVYLPKGETWTDFWTGEKYAGGQYVEADASEIPVFVRSF